jgi:hypothetical protein
VTAIKDEWVAALRSGEYKQFHGDWNNGGENPTEHCCLDVLQIVLTGKPFGVNNDSEIMSRNLALGTVSKLAAMNDRSRASFGEIANYIEEHVDV